MKTESREPFPALYLQRIFYMNTKLIMTASAVMLGAVGIAFIFIPEEILHLLSSETNVSSLLLLQIMGALYFGFAMLNWMSRNSVIGGIYNKPVAVANYAHFFAGGIALAKALLKNPALPSLLWVIAAVYLLFAVIFVWIFYKNPSAPKQ